MASGGSSILSEKGAEGLANWMKSWGFEPIAIFPAIFAVLFLCLFAFDFPTLRAFLFALTALSPIWLPVMLAKLFWMMWMEYIRFLTWMSTEMVLVKIELPQEVERSPLAIELFLSALHNPAGEATFLNRIWKGMTRPVWSLEIAGNEGRIGFYIHMRRAMKHVIEARLYGLFHEAKITEVDDYASRIPFSLDTHDLLGFEFKKTSIGALPITTYIDYKLDKNEDQEYRVDPLANILEVMNSTGPGEHFWMQIIMRARKKDEWFGFYKSGDSYADPGKEEIKKIMAGAAKRAKSVIEESAVADAKVSLLTEMEKRRIENIERSLSKPTFEAGVRVIYAARKERFNSSIVGTVGIIFNPFKTAGSNALVPTRGLTEFDYPWQEWFKTKADVKNTLFFNYKNRLYFYSPYDQIPIFFSIEEVATLWHFPGTAVMTPGLERIVSRRAEAPTNLPTG